MEEVSVSEALEEFRERLERWDELCAQLRELYYKYLDLAAFRSEKCYFPGRKCVRSWDRRYDIGDLTLMWTYILNTAPLCGKLMKALAEVEYKIRLKAVESLEKYGGIVRKSKTSSNAEVVIMRLGRPIYVYLVLWDKLYVIWGEFDKLPRNSMLRAAEVERRIVDIVKRHKRGERADMQVDEFDVDREYERLWFDVPLPGNISKLFGGRDRAPVALFRNLGWLLSDDFRQYLRHGAGNAGQAAVRLFDWIALAKYTIDVLKGASEGLLVFKLAVYYVAKTKKGVNPRLEMRPIGTAAEAIRMAYSLFGITPGGPDVVLAYGYILLKALRESAFKREGRVYVVDDVGAWVALSSAVVTLVLGDGYITGSAGFSITAKALPKMTLLGESAFAKDLAKAIGGTTIGKEVRLQSWHMRLLLPIPSTPVFEKTVKLYETLLNYPAVALVEVDGVTYLLSYNNSSGFVIGIGKAAKLYEALSRLGLKVKTWNKLLVLTYSQLKKLAKLGFVVRLLNDFEKDAIREVKPAPSMPDLDVIKRLFEEIAKVAKIYVGQCRNHKCVYIVLRDKSKLEEIIVMLKSARIRFSVNRRRGTFYIREQKSAEVILKALSYLFSTTQFCGDYTSVFMHV